MAHNSPSTPVQVYVTHDEIPWEEVERDSRGDRVAQLRIGDHVVLAIPFWESDREYASDTAARVVAEKLRSMLDESRTA